MLTTQRIREHFESLEMERLRAEVKELQTHLSRLQFELTQFRRDPQPVAVGVKQTPSQE